MALDNFTHSVGISEYPALVGGTKRFYISYNWKINQRTHFNLTDKIGISWTDDYDLVNNSAAWGYNPTGVNSNGQSCSRNFSYTGNDKYTPGAGVGWAVDIMHNFTAIDGKYCETNKHAGWAHAQVVRPHDDSGTYDSSSLAAKYFHRFGALNGTLDFSGGSNPSVSIGFSWFYDTSSDLPKQWFWRHLTTI
ncbi:hypothetical protein EBB07_31585 [Paenibacillaceae bacterium]|nr:hypothetical protein EBB07_31585 [Paenibacillaceae bacterium]